jgi:hypothetical protein
MKRVIIATVLLLVTLGPGLMMPADLPPRPTVEPIPEPKEYEGGIVELQVSGMTIPLWTEVEWQDFNGDWHLVDGWRGTIEVYQPQQWWVGAEHLGEKAFRWLVYDQEGGELLATSNSFDLPEGNRQKVIVTVTLDS